MNAQPAAVPAEPVEIRRFDLPSLRQDRVERQRRVALRKHEAIPARVIAFVRPKHAAEESREDLGDAERRADVADACPVAHLEDGPADPVGELPGVVREGGRRSTR